ncbi:hypothetical protein [Thiohalorhabdus sp.]
MSEPTPETGAVNSVDPEEIAFYGHRVRSCLMPHTPFVRFD